MTHERRKKIKEELIQGELDFISWGDPIETSMQRKEKL